MANVGPEVIIRLGSHAEKEYVLKLARFLDGIIVGANLFEAAPAATASLLLAVGGKNTKLYLDPMTYAYGAYIDPQNDHVRSDLNWIKSEQIRRTKDGKKTFVREFKRSYKQLASVFGAPLKDAVKESRAVSAESFKENKVCTEFCRSVAQYQLTRIREVAEEDENLKDLREDLPTPTAVFAPYFYIEPTNTEEWLLLNLKLMKTTVNLSLNLPVHGIVCADVQHLKDPSVMNRLGEVLPTLGLAGVWLWFSKFFEEAASTDVLKSFRDLVVKLSPKLEVHTMHGGFFSLALSKFGMRGVSHGVGYGEQKDVVPVIGQSTPTVRYYLPPLARRLGVPEIERAFGALGIRTPEDFHSRVCDCSVCRSVVTNSINEFSAFGVMHRSRPEAKRLAQTPAAAKRCRFHFLLARLQEKLDLQRLSLEEVIDRLNAASKTWGTQPSLRNHGSHLSRWSDALKQSR